MRRTVFSLVFLVFTLSCQSQPAAPGKAAKVVKVIDGDTVELLKQDSTIKVRLFGIDAPERGQEFYNEAKETLEELVLGKEVIVHVNNVDVYRRQVATLIRLQDNVNVNYKMVEKGMAWHFTRYSSDPQLAKLQVKAREKFLGIWSLYHFLEPWEYRKNRQ